ncbi:MAG: AMP-binding protein [Candidatus Rokuibacteriota bacterium]|nr:MAG: AMP-binding protein [Candidatus Rokubacteria bacterium]
MDPRAVTRFGDLTDAAAAWWGDREALVFRDSRYTFRQIATEVDRVARGLIHVGVRPGEKVAIWLLNCPEWIFAMFALAKIGAVHVPINTRFRTVDLGLVLERSSATTVITHDVSGPVDYLGMIRELVDFDDPSGDRRVRSARLPDLERVIVVSDRRYPGAWSWPDLLASASTVPPATLAARESAVRPTDTVFIMYTSGTTGFPKGVMRDHTMLAHLADRYRRLQSTERDVFVNYLPLFHIFGYIEGPLGSMLTGYRQILTDTFDPDETLDLVEREGATHIDGFDTHLKLLIDAQEARPRNLSTLRTGVIAGGAASATPLVYRARKVLAPLRHLTAYGMTEVGATISLSFLDSTEEQACEASGAPCEGFEVRVIDPDTGLDQPRGTPGEVVVRTRYLMQGYYRDPEATARAIDTEGWFHTGDAGILRADGHLRFVGRYKDMIKVGGENVDPTEVESYLSTYPGVSQAAFVSYPEARLGEVGVAFVQVVPGASVDPDGLIAFCRGRIASFKIPRHVLIVDELPMTSSGKVQKARLREVARERLG